MPLGRTKPLVYCILFLAVFFVNDLHQHAASSVYRARI